MKQVHYFIACPGKLTPQVVLYLVMVGKSEREQKAHAWLIRHCANDNREKAILTPKIVKCA